MMSEREPEGLVFSPVERYCRLCRRVTRHGYGVARGVRMVICHVCWQVTISDPPPAATEGRGDAVGR
jgi:hypothetical protein